MLATHDLSYQYPGGEQLNFPDISCARGETWLLLGASGSGKTTLLQLLAGLRTPTGGEVLVDDQALGKLTGSNLDRFRGKKLGIIFQTAHFVRSVSIAENLALAQRLAGNPVDYDRIQTLLDQLDIGNKADASPAALSVGQQQRAAIARAIINQPSVILADEPTSALDDANTEKVIDLLREQAAAVNATLLIVTHDNRLTQVIDQQIRL